MTCIVLLQERGGGVSLSGSLPRRKHALPRNRIDYNRNNREKQHKNQKLKNPKQKNHQKHQPAPRGKKN
jgi:hypothetical protein